MKAKAEFVDTDLPKEEILKAEAFATKVQDFEKRIPGILMVHKGKIAKVGDPPRCPFILKICNFSASRLTVIESRTLSLQ